jgi:hypothetical protein
MSAARLPDAFIDPPRECSVMPFWFWNDELEEAEIRRQIGDFESHGVYGFIIHPRMGLPRRLAWISEPLLAMYDVALDEAHRRGLYVLLYDEGMYPSGSSHGQVVAENPLYATRALTVRELPDAMPPTLPPGHHLVAVCQRVTGGHVAVVDQPAGTSIRGIHYVDEKADAQLKEPREVLPPAADLLNPDAVDCFLRLVYDRFAARYRRHFGGTILAMFTDEPDVLGKFYPPHLRPGTTGILDHVRRLLGYDFTPHLPTLWYDDEPDAARHRAAYHWAIDQRMQETYYQRLSDWCRKHGLPLTGHPAQSDEIGALRHFDMPGQDLVWRMVLPGPTATQGRHATQAKCSSSAAIHLRRRRNANECCGAYGHELTCDQMRWLADWCFVRGVNLLYPHAFYYSVRGPRRDERPPDVGPNSPWWSSYRDYADGCRRLSWLNLDSTHVCRVAILGESNHLAWQAAQVLQRRQIDFNYLEARHLMEDAVVSERGIDLADMHDDVLIVDHVQASPPGIAPALNALAAAGRLLHHTPTAISERWPGARALHAEQLVAAVRQRAPDDLRCAAPQPELRYRHVRKLDADWYLVFNEGVAPIALEIDVAAPGARVWIDPCGRQPVVLPAPPQQLEPMRMLVLRCS